MSEKLGKIYIDLSLLVSNLESIQALRFMIPPMQDEISNLNDEIVKLEERLVKLESHESNIVQFNVNGKDNDFSNLMQPSESFNGMQKIIEEVQDRHRLKKNLQVS